MPERKIYKFQLQNGLTGVFIDLPQFHSITTFLAVRSGSRYESEETSGLAHFLEHMVFKGTARYPNTAALAAAIEGVGGVFNAWTSVDQTVYYNTVPTSAWRTGLAMPLELAFRPLLNEADLDRERGVIIEEIRMIQDDPARYVYDLSRRLVFNASSLGRPIIGTEETVGRLAIKDFCQYRDEFYHPGQSVIAVVGNLENHPIEAELSRLTADLVPQKTAFFTPVVGSSSRDVSHLDKKTDQTHLVVSVADPILRSSSPDLAVAEVLNAVLGVGMSSRLFLRVREQKGLAYAVRSTLDSLEDTGEVSIYAGVNTAKVDQALVAVVTELQNLSTALLTENELEKAKTMLIGSFEMAADRPDYLARFYALGALLYGEKSLNQLKDEVKAVTAKQVLNLAKEIFQPEKLTLASIGPRPTGADFQRTTDSFLLVKK